MGVNPAPHEKGHPVRELSDRVAEGMKRLLAESNELLTGGVILPVEPPTTKIKAFLEPTAEDDDFGGCGCEYCEGED